MPTRQYFIRKAERLFEEWDNIEDPYGLPTEEFKKAVAKVNEACLIFMVLQAKCPYGLEDGIGDCTDTGCPSYHHCHRR